MASLTVAVPVYNEAEMLRATLDEVSRQSFGDFVVLVFDNASTDATPQVAAEFAARDPRFRHVRQPYNKGALANFHESLMAAETPFFIWRAADDRWSDNYLEALHGLLTANPRDQLAVGTIETADLDGRKRRIAAFPARLRGQGAGGVIRMLRASKAAWIYGMFRREALTARMNEVVASYGHPWGFDHLVLFRFILEDVVAGTAETTFYQIIKRTRGQATIRRTPPALEQMLELRHKFYALARRDIETSARPPVWKAVWRAYLWFYTGKRVYRFEKILKRSLLEKVSRVSRVAP
ncbi:glycosyltransferase [Alsobacter sp. SYSU M60028]|uniref:Glycosyltransferase n=1 Tax=Alsobacter ponti TaxID=2962936 RepID=A0ABT1LF35_9HYPH|nr:glycosyltransferase family 2 protein [Alsobacter ponti]MCP8940107.1 glycosyltransferase [Alsobacter ponti]